MVDGASFLRYGFQRTSLPKEPSGRPTAGALSVSVAGLRGVPDVSREELLRQLGALVDRRDEERDALVRALIAVDSCDHRIGVLIDRLVEEQPNT